MSLLLANRPARLSWRWIAETPCRSLAASPPKAWTDREGVVRPALDLVASQVLTAYHVERKRKAVEPLRHDQDDTQLANPASRRDDLDDGAPLNF